MNKAKFRLVTRSDFDGLICAVLFKELEMINEIKFVHPKDMQDGIIEITSSDITTNLPYSAKAHLVFDHHLSESMRHRGKIPSNYIMDSIAPSAARVVYDYYGGKARFKDIPEEMILAVDKADSAQFSEEEILEPSGWVLLNYIMDPRTGLGRFREFRISNYDLMMQLITACRTMSIEEILELPDVQERVKLYEEHRDLAEAQLQKCCTIHKNLIVLDLRNEETIWCTNRFTLYALYPQCDISIHVLWGAKKQNTVFATGKSIINRENPLNVGEIMLSYNGGGHTAAGTCQVPNDKADIVLNELIARITR